MPAPVEIALATLLPTISFLPPDLISLSNSLLSQSRAKAASLKPEEEIGRTYACCHIACERLKKRLDLEIGKPAPPVKPRVYDKLYRYLDGVLTTPVTRAGVRTPNNDRVRDVGTSGSKSGSTVKKREKEQKEARTPSIGIKRKIEAVDEDREVPDFVMPMIRTICKANDTPLAAPHVLVGATSVVREIVSRISRRAADDQASKRKRRTPQSTRSTASSAVELPNGGIAISRWPALLIALYVLTAAKMRSTEIESKEMDMTKLKSTAAVKTFCEETGGALAEELEVGMAKLDSNIGFYVLEGEDYGWLDMEWYQNVPAGVDDADAQEVERSEPSEAEQEVLTPRKRPHKTPLQRKEKHGGIAVSDQGEKVGAAGLLPGLGTMFQPAIDWLSDERRRDFAVWKKNILQKVSAIEANV